MGKIDTLEPLERFENVKFWKAKVIPFVEHLVDELVRKVEKNPKNHKVTDEDKRVMFENYLGMATEVYCCD